MPMTMYFLREPTVVIPLPGFDLDERIAQTRLSQNASELFEPVDFDPLENSECFTAIPRFRCSCLQVLS